MSKRTYVYERVATHPLDKIMPIIAENRNTPDRASNRIELDGIKVGVTSQRLKVFLEKGQTCKCCGKVATHFAVERDVGKSNEPFHLNMYGRDGGKEVLFTKQQIVPKSQGGTKAIDNYMTVCEPCGKNHWANLS